jgi:hypothetical protein
MDEKDLIKTLAGLEESLIRLFETAQKKQEALVNNNIKLLESAVSAEERFIRNIENAEKNRVSVLAELNKKYMIDAATMKLSDFLSGAKNKLDEKSTAQILKLQNRIKKHILNIEMLNQQNQYLLDTARDFIKMAISELVGPQRKSFLDRRV